MLGVVKWFSDSRGFGFITAGSKEYFVHYKEISGQGFRSLAAGERVSFLPATSPKGDIAKSVEKEGSPLDL